MKLTITKSDKTVTLTWSIPVGEDPFITVKRADGKDKPVLTGDMRLIEGEHDIGEPNGVQQLAQITFGRPAPSGGNVEAKRIATKGLVGIESAHEPLRSQIIADCNVGAASFWYTPTWFKSDAEAAANRPNCDWSAGFLKSYPAMRAVLRFGREPMDIPQDDAALARYCRPVLEDHGPYAGRIIVGGANEPQYAKYFVGTIEQCVERVQAPLYKLAKSMGYRVATPSIVFDGSSNDAKVWKQFTDAGVMSFADIVDLHWYGTSAGLAASLALIPSGIPIIMSEWNGPTYGKKDPADLLKCWDISKTRCELECLYAAKQGKVSDQDVNNQLFDPAWNRIAKWYDNYKAMA